MDKLLERIEKLEKALERLEFSIDDAHGELAMDQLEMENRIYIVEQLLKDVSKLIKTATDCKIDEPHYPEF